MLMLILGCSLPSCGQSKYDDEVTIDGVVYHFYLDSKGRPKSKAEVYDYVGSLPVSKEVIIPETITLENYEGSPVLRVVGISNFQSDSAKYISSVVLPKTLKIIGNGAFMDTNLSYIQIPDSVTFIGSRAFYSRSSVLKVRLSHITELYSGYEHPASYYFPFRPGCCFFELSSSGILSWLMQFEPQGIIFLPGYEEGNVTHWNEWNSVQKIISLDTTPPMIGDSFSDFQKKNLRVFVPTSALEAYKNAPVWKDFFFLKAGAETTGIESVPVSTVVDDEQMYGIDGQRVDNPTPGSIYIKGNKKYVAK